MRPPFLTLALLCSLARGVVTLGANSHERVASLGRRLAQVLPPPPPYSPAPPLPTLPATIPSCPTVANFTGTAWVTGTYCAPGACPSTCGTNAPNGALICTDGSCYAHYYAWTVPTGAVSLSDQITCYMATNSPRYCPANASYPYCEAARNPTPVCEITAVAPAPPAPPPTPPAPLAVQCATATNSTGGYVSGVYCTNVTCPAAACQGKCNFGGLLCADGGVYANYYPFTVPSYLPSTGAALLQCNIITSGQYCPGGAGGFCEPTNGGITNCVIAAVLAAPPPAPPPPPTPPALQCGHADGLSSFTWVSGLFCSNVTCPPSCSYGDGISNCRFGGMVCADGSVYASYNPWMVPPGAVPGQSLLQCYMRTNPNYCPAINGSISYCEPGQDQQLSCTTSAVPPSPPPPFPPAPPPAPLAVQCLTAMNSTNPGGDYVSGTYCSNVTCPVGACSGKCNFGGLICADGSVYANYYNWTVPSNLPTTGVALLQCVIITSGQYCPGSSPGFPGYCEPTNHGIFGCTIAADAPAPPPSPPPPPNPVANLCGHANSVATETWVSGYYCADNTTCPISCSYGDGISNCRFGGLVCADGSVYAAYNSWTVPAGAQPNQLVQCLIKTNPNYCPASDGSISYCEPASGEQLFCVIPPIAPPPPPPLRSPPPRPPGLAIPPPPAGASPSPSDNKNGGLGNILAIVFGSALAVTLLGIAAYAIWRRRQVANSFGAHANPGLAMGPMTPRSAALFAQATAPPPPAIDPVKAQRERELAAAAENARAAAAAQAAAAAAAQAAIAARAPRQGSMQDDISKIMGGGGGGAGGANQWSL